MSKAKTTDTAAPGQHVADRHDLIRVHGARVNNLKDVSVELPKRRLTVFTGVSGSGKSSLVFGTIAAESQRLINETYSTFVQGFMPTMARPDVDVLDGLTTAILVDQERMGANPRSTVGTATDANAMLRILFSRLGKPHIGSPQAFAFNVPSVRRQRRHHRRAGRGQDQDRAGDVQPPRWHVPALRGHGPGVGLRPHPALRRQQVAQRGRAHRSPATAWRAGTAASTAAAAGSTPTSRSRSSPRRSSHDLLYKEATKIKVDGINLTYLGLIPQIQKSFLSKDVEAMQPHIRAFVERVDHLHRLPRMRRHPAEQGRPVVEDQGDQHRRRLRDADHRPRRLGPSAEGAVGRAAARQRCGDRSTPSWTSAWATSRSNGPSGTLSGGEAQRTKMIRHLGSSLTDVTYVFDEPTIGLHPHDIQRMNDLLLQLRDKGNTVLVVEHKPEAIAIADHVVDLGPGAGSRRRHHLLRGHRRRGCGPAAPSPAATSTTGPRSRPRCAPATGALEIRGADDQQPAEGRRRHPPRGALRDHRRGGLGQELADPRLGGRSATAWCSIDQGAIKGSRRSNPATYTGPARADPQGVRQGQQREAGAVQRQLRGCLPQLQRQRVSSTPSSGSWTPSPPRARSARASGSTPRC